MRRDRGARLRKSRLFSAAAYRGGDVYARSSPTSRSRPALLGAFQQVQSTRSSRIEAFTGRGRSRLGC